MANRYTINGCQSFNKGLTLVEGQLTIGGSGAVSSIEGAGISTITKTASAGSYQITLEDGYKKLLGSNFTVMAVDATAATGVDAVAFTDIANINAASSPHVNIALTLNNALADAVSGTIVRFMLWFRNSSLKGKGE